jgi:CDGSH-type Zn-finger protein
MNQRPAPPEIPSFLQAMRCQCGKARQGPYCDGSHMTELLEPRCESSLRSPREERGAAERGGGRGD